MSEWISVEDRLPESDQAVVFADIGHRQIYSVVAGEYQHGRFWADTDGLCAENYDGGAHIELSMVPTHWMPLPEPPSGE